MATTKTSTRSSIVAVYPNHAAAENAVRSLQKEGFPMQQLSIIGRDFQTVEKPLGFVTSGTVAKEGAKVGAWTGGIFGLLIGAAFLILPGVGPVVIAGPLSAAILAGAEGAVAGAALGGLTGALIGLGLSKDEAIRYEAKLKTGKYLLTVSGDAAQIEKAKGILGASKPETTQVVESSAG